MNAPYFPFYPGDWLSDSNVQIMNMEETGAYITLLAHMWKDGKDCTLPDDDDHLAKLLRVSIKKWSRIKKTLVSGSGSVFYQSKDGRLRNRRLDKEWSKAASKISKKVEAANKRWSNASDLQMQSKRNADASVVHMQNDAIRDLDSDSDSDKRSERELARAQIVQAYEQVCGAIEGVPPQDFELLLDYFDVDKMDSGLVINAVHKSAEADHPAKYACGILKGWKRKGITTLSTLIETTGGTQYEYSTTRNGPKKVPDFAQAADGGKFGRVK